MYSWTISPCGGTDFLEAYTFPRGLNSVTVLVFWNVINPDWGSESLEPGCAGKLACRVWDRKSCESWPSFFPVFSAVLFCSHLHSWKGQPWVSNVCIQSNLSPPHQGSVRWCHPLHERSRYQFISSSASDTRKLMLKLKCYETWRWKKEPLIWFKVMHIYVSGSGIFEIECDVFFICAEGEFSLTILNLMAGKLVTLAQAHYLPGDP